MKQHRELSLWLVTLVGCTSAVTIACGDAAGPDDSAAAGSAGTAVTAGAGGVGTAGAPVVGTAGTPSGGAGSPGTSGAPTTAGVSSTGGGGAGTAGAGGGSTAGTGGGGMAGAAGGGSAGAAGNGNSGPFGITTCQPAFETACKPPVIFENQDPTGKGKVFTDVVPDVVKTEQEIACTACSILYRTPDEIPTNKHPKQIRIVLDTHGGVAQAGGDQIQFDLNYINGYKGRDPKVIEQEMKGVLQHETVHLYQNYGNGGTGEGLADLVRARTGYYPKSRWRKGEGTWQDAYTASGNFYSWLTGPCSYHSTFFSKNDLNFPYKLNKALAGKSGDAAYDAAAALIQTSFGKSPDDLWDEYQSTAF